MSAAPAVRRFGDRALLFELGDQPAARRLARVADHARANDSWPGLEDVVIGLRSLTVLFDPARLDVDAFAAWVAATDLPPELTAGDRVHGAPLEIPVCFDGPDLDEVATLVGCSPGDVVALLVESPLEVAFLGFSPGFAYLLGLPPALADLPRRPTPRPSVPAGTLAVGGGFAAVYPQSTPGGWHLVGRTGITLFDPGRPPYAALAPGQRVVLRPTAEAPDMPPPIGRPSLAPGTDRALIVERGGTCTLVEDSGRIGTAGLGVPRAGAADPVAARLANRLVGNDDAEAVVEVTLVGPQLRATTDCTVAVVGIIGQPGRVELLLDGRPASEAAVIPVAAGQLLDIRRCDQVVRATLAVDGGLRTPVVLGSRSSDVLCGLGPRPLEPGDALALGPPRRPHGRLEAGLGSSPVVLRVLPGPDAPPDVEQLGETLSGEWLVGSDSNRVGVRLRPAEPIAAGESSGPDRVPSRGMVRGAVQLPPGGEAIVLGPDHATVGGYPVPAVVVAADLHRLAHVRPGDTVTWAVVDGDEAQSARRALERTLDRAVHGWFPTRAG